MLLNTFFLFQADALYSIIFLDFSVRFFFIILTVVLFVVLCSTGAACASQMYRLQMENIAGKWEKKLTKIIINQQYSKCLFSFYCKQKQ